MDSKTWWLVGAVSAGVAALGTGAFFLLKEEKPKKKSRKHKSKAKAKAHAPAARKPAAVAAGA
jgi:hypothetical protein